MPGILEAYFETCSNKYGTGKEPRLAAIGHDHLMTPLLCELLTQRRMHGGLASRSGWMEWSRNNPPRFRRCYYMIFDWRWFPSDPRCSSGFSGLQNPVGLRSLPGCHDARAVLLSVAPHADPPYI